MFRSTRLRLTLLLVGLSALVYILVVGIGASVFHQALTESLDQELNSLTAELTPTIDYDNAVLALDKDSSHIHPKRLPFVVRVSLFDPQGKLLTHTGPAGSTAVEPQKHEVKVNGQSLRTLCSPLYTDKEKIGYLQIQLPTDLRDKNTHEFVVSMVKALPALIVFMGAAGYFFTGIAMKPVEKSFASQRRFVQDAGHELKTPLTIAQATLENLKRELGETTSHKDRLTALARSIERMSELVRDLLYLSTAESKQLNQSVSPVVLDETMHEAVQELKPLFEKKGVNLIESREAGSASVAGNKEAIYRVISNLLSNALRYTETGGTVNISSSLRGKQVFIRVQDSGCGISAEAIPFIFDRFYRVDNGRARQDGGSGLGLSITKAIVESHGGNVTVASVVGSGSTFVVQLPHA